MSNVHNLKPFQKGVSGNPNGRPRKIPALDELLADILNEETDGVSVARQILEMYVREALKGNLTAAEALFNRAYGKPKPAAQDDGKDVTVRVIRECSDDELLDKVNGIFDVARKRKIESDALLQNF